MKFGPKPNKPGIWQWYDETGVARLVDVVDVWGGVGRPYLRVVFWGGYYDVHDSEDREAEWPDRWGSYVGQRGNFGEDEIFSMPVRLTT